MCGKKSYILILFFLERRSAFHIPKTNLLRHCMRTIFIYWRWGFSWIIGHIAFRSIIFANKLDPEVV
jgi:hypothetical protein